VAVSVPPEFQAIVAELEARGAPTANGVASGGSGHVNGPSADGAASKAATNGSPASAPNDGSKASVCDVQCCCCVTRALRACCVINRESLWAAHAASSMLDRDTAGAAGCAGGRRIQLPFGQHGPGAAAHAARVRGVSRRRASVCLGHRPSRRRPPAGTCCAGTVLQCGHQRFCSTSCSLHRASPLWLIMLLAGATRPHHSIYPVKPVVPCARQPPFDIVPVLVGPRV